MWFFVIFQSEMLEMVGFVWSVREYFVIFSSGFNSIFVYYGWSFGVKKQLEFGVYDYINGLDFDGSLFWRVDFSKFFYNFYMFYDNIRKVVE